MVVDVFHVVQLQVGLAGALEDVQGGFVQRLAGVLEDVVDQGSCKAQRLA